MFPQVSTTAPNTAAAPTVARPPTAARAPLGPAGPRPAKLAHWRASAFSIFADDQAQGPFSLWPRTDSPAKVPKPAAPAKKKGKAAVPSAAEEAEELSSQMGGKQNMRFRSALEQVSYYTNESAFQRGE